MKYLLGVSVFLSFLAAGVYEGEKLTSKAKTLERILMFLNECRGRIDYREEPFPQIIKSFKSQNGFSLTEKCTEYMSSLDFPEAWEKSVKELKYISAADRSVLLSFGGAIGRSDKKSQLNLIDYTVSLLSESLNMSKEKVKNDKKLYAAVGFLLGMLSLIIII